MSPAAAFWTELSRQRERAAMHVVALEEAGVLLPAAGVSDSGSTSTSVTVTIEWSAAEGAALTLVASSCRLVAPRRRKQD